MKSCWFQRRGKCGSNVSYFERQKISMCYYDMRKATWSRCQWYRVKSVESGFSRPVLRKRSPLDCLSSARNEAVFLDLVLDVIMPTKSARGDGRSTKRVKLDATPSNAYHYSDGADIERRLQAETQDDLLAGEFLSA